jgi:hypothetical protein
MNTKCGHKISQISVKYDKNLSTFYNLHMYVRPSKNIPKLGFFKVNHLATLPFPRMQLVSNIFTARSKNVIGLY